MPANNHNGTTRAVRDYVLLNGPSSVYDIAQGLGLEISQVKAATSLMVTRLGGVVPVDKRGKKVLYGIPGRDNATMKRSPRAAGPRYKGPISVLKRDPFSHMRLALTVRGGV